MTGWQLRLATAALLVVIAVVSFELFGSGPRTELPPALPGQELARDPLPTAEIDPSDESSDDGYVPAAESNLIPDRDAAPLVDEDDQLSEDECLAFVAHVQRIQGEPGAAGNKKEARALCEADDIRPEFARCALAVNTSRGLMDCAEAEMAAKTEDVDQDDEADPESPEAP